MVLMIAGHPLAQVSPVRSSSFGGSGAWWLGSCENRRQLVAVQGGRLVDAPPPIGDHKERGRASGPVRHWKLDDRLGNRLSQ